MGITITLGALEGATQMHTEGFHTYPHITHGFSKEEQHKFQRGHIAKEHHINVVREEEEVCISDQQRAKLFVHDKHKRRPTKQQELQSTA